MHFLDLLFPKFCVSCGKPGSYICRRCQKTIIPIRVSETICPICERSAIGGKSHPYCRNKYSLDGLISFFHYRGAIQKAIKSIKYQFVSDISETIIAYAFQSQNILETYPFLAFSTIIPIPLHRSRFRFRGFNQAELFGKELAHIYQLFYAHDMIRRKKYSVPQVEMKSRKERLVNMKDMFEVIGRKSMPKTVLIVDDVFTTGATMREAGRVLKHSGAEVVWGVTIAR